MTSSSFKDDKSAKSWGVPQSPGSPASTWGTLSTASSNPSLQAVIDHKTSRSPPNNINVGSTQGWASNASPPIYPSPSLAWGNSHNTGTYSGYSSPSPLISSPASSWTRLSPLLDSRSSQCIQLDVGYPVEYMYNMNESAVQPPVTFMQVFIVVQPGFKWPVNIQVHGPVSVYQVLQHIHEFLQGNQNAHDLQKSRLIPSAYNNTSQSDTFREESHSNGFHSGRKRIDILGRQRLFRGLSPEPGREGAWIVHLSDR